MATIIHRVAIHTTAGSVIPALADKGAMISKSAWSSAGFKTIGAVFGGDDGDLDSDSIDPSYFNEGVDIHPPGSPVRTGHVARQFGIDTVQFVAYDTSQAIFMLNSYGQVADSGDGNVVDYAAAPTYRALAIEYLGEQVLYFPKVILTITGSPGGFGPGDDAVAKFQFEAKVFSDSNHPSGFKRHYFVEAGV